VLLTSQQAERLPGLVADITTWMRSQKEFVGIDSESESALPELVAGIGRRTLARLGGNVKKVDTTLQSGFGPRQIGFLGSTNETRGLSVGLMEKWRKDESSFPLLGLDVGSWGRSGRLDEVLSWNTTTVSRQVERYNRLPASTISFNIVKGADSGKALKMLSQKLDEVSNGPDQARLAGVAKEIAESIARTGPMVLLALLVMYLVLGVLYESLIHPFTVLVGLPSALLGGLFALWITELELDIYGFMGLLMLMGIVKKNAIMLVDFAQQLQSTGVGPEQAILEASRERLRPIQMTTLAAAAGALPLIAGIGSGSHALRPVGVILLGGLLCSQVVTLVLTPSVYRFMDRTFIRKRRKVIT
jgi:HAE1 family hydrophobic/amphiphilic exporter-1